jgi:AcrR family transcriptional regulator
VLRAARRSFAAKGYAGTSNREIAAAAGLAHTAIYNHFGSKAQLFTAVFLDVQDLLVVELDRSVAAAPDGPALPGALLDAIAALRAADPSYVEFLASMYVEVGRHAELQEVFRGGGFPIVARLRELSGIGDDAHDDDASDGAMWFWIAFALGLAQISVLADAETFATTLETFRHRFDPGVGPGDPATPSSPSPSTSTERTT